MISAPEGKVFRYLRDILSLLWVLLLGGHFVKELTQLQGIVQFCRSYFLGLGDEILTESVKILMYNGIFRLKSLPLI
jgi:hypothetical protein